MWIKVQFIIIDTFFSRSALDFPLIMRDAIFSIPEYFLNKIAITYHDEIQPELIYSFFYSTELNL